MHSIRGMKYCQMNTERLWCESEGQLLIIWQKVYVYVFVLLFLILVSLEHAIILIELIADGQHGNDSSGFSFWQIFSEMRNIQMWLISSSTSHKTSELLCELLMLLFAHFPRLKSTELNSIGQLHSTIADPNPIKNYWHIKFYWLLKNK